MKRVLIVQRAIHDAHMGAIRSRRIANHLPRYGWDPIVLANKASALQDVHPPLEAPVLGAADREWAAWYARLRRMPATRPACGQEQPAPSVRDIRLTSFINRWFMMPDKYAGWVRNAIRLGRAAIREHRPDVVFASLEPRSNLLVASRLAREFSIPCLMEYRDLWTGSPYAHIAEPTALHRWLHHRLERQCLYAATRLTCVSQGIAEYLEQKYGMIYKRTPDVVYNFFDPDEYNGPPVRREKGPFTISYVGAMYVSRNPLAFFEGFRQFIDQRGLTPDNIQFRWVGSAYGIPNLTEALGRLALTPYIAYVGQVSHEQALNELQASDAALVIQSPDDAIHIPGKLFEALGARVPTLLMADKGEVKDIVEQTRAGVVVRHEAADVVSGLNALYAVQRPWAYDEVKRNQYAADVMVEKLARLLEEAALS